MVQAVKHARTIQQEIRIAQAMTNTELYGYAKKLGVDVELLKKTRELGRLPVVNFAAGGLGEIKLHIQGREYFDMFQPHLLMLAC